MSRSSLGGGRSTGSASSGGGAVLSLPPVTLDGEIWERFPLYAAPSSAPPFHLVKFLSALPLANAPKATPTVAPGVAAAGEEGPEGWGAMPPPPASATVAAAAASSGAPPKLAYPFSKDTRLCSPRHTDYRSKFIQRKKVQKGGIGAAAANASAGAAALASTKSEEKSAASGDPDGINPLDRKWRLEDPRAIKGAPSYLGAREPPPRKEIHAMTPNHFLLLQRSPDGKFSFVNVENYAFRHVDSSAATTSLEEAEQKMKQRMKRFEKRVKSMNNILGGDEDEEGGAGGAAGKAGGGGGGLAMEGARPSIAGKIQPAERVEKADDAFEDMGVVSSKSAAAAGASVASLTSGARKAAQLARSAKIKREGGADYTRQFDDDDVDFTAEDMLDVSRRTFTAH